MKISSPEGLLLASMTLALIPLLIAVGTCYLKFTIVLSILRSGFGTQQAPSTSLIVALSVVMSLAVMKPVVTAGMDRLSGIQLHDLTTSSMAQLVERARTVVQPWREFLEEHCGARELAAFRAITGEAAAEGEDVQAVRSTSSLIAVVGAFVLSEIKKGFTIAFFLLIPFFVIDMVVANILVGMGLTMMSPVIVSLPLKLLLFVTSDGWLLLAQSLTKSYQ